MTKYIITSDIHGEGAKSNPRLPANIKRLLESAKNSRSQIIDGGDLFDIYLLGSAYSKDSYENFLKLFSGADFHTTHIEPSTYRGPENHRKDWIEMGGFKEETDNKERLRAFAEKINNLGATFHKNGSLFTLDNLAVFLQHDLINYDKGYNESRFVEVAKILNRQEYKNCRKLAVYGHTHTPKLEKVDGVWFINPGAFYLNGRYAIYNSDEDAFEIKSDIGKK